MSRRFAIPQDGELLEVVRPLAGRPLDKGPITPSQSRHCGLEGNGVQWLTGRQTTDGDPDQGQGHYQPDDRRLLERAPDQQGQEVSVRTAAGAWRAGLLPGVQGWAQGREEHRQGQEGGAQEEGSLDVAPARAERQVNTILVQTVFASQSSALSNTERKRYAYHKLKAFRFQLRCCRQRLDLRTFIDVRQAQRIASFKEDRISGGRQVQSSANTPGRIPTLDIVLDIRFFAAGNGLGAGQEPKSEAGCQIWPHV